MTIGRMNQPTYGHKKLIQQMVKEANKLQEKEVYIILSDSLDTKVENGQIKENPLSCAEKIAYLGEIVADIEEKSGVKVIIRCMNASPDPPIPHCEGKNTTYKQVCILVEEFKTYIPAKNLDLLLMVGTDRIVAYDWLKTAVGPTVPIKYGEVKRGEAVKLHCSAMDCVAEAKTMEKTISTLAEEESMSATKLKNLARQKENPAENSADRERFIAETRKSGLSEAKCTELYHALQARLMSQIEYTSLEADIAEKNKKKIMTTIKKKGGRTMKKGNGNKKKKGPVRRKKTRRYRK